MLKIGLKKFIYIGNLRKSCKALIKCVTIGDFSMTAIDSELSCSPSCTPHLEMETLFNQKPASELLSASDLLRLLFLFQWYI